MGRRRSVSHRVWLALLPLAARLAAQPIQIQVRSEFQRIDPWGRIVAVDRAEQPREILSPAVPRNGHTSFHVAVTVPENTPFSLYFGQNPEGSVDYTVYLEQFVRSGGGWVPDGLRRILIPYRTGGQPGQGIPGQTTTVFWLDIWAPPHARVGRTRFEVQLNVGERWIIYPMELRILHVRVPELPGAAAGPAPVEAPADASALAVLRPWLCGGRPERAAAPLSVRRLIRRNAQQDLALARALETRLGRDAVAAGLARAAGFRSPEDFCRATPRVPSLGAEWYLRLRDYLYRAADSSSVDQSLLGISTLARLPSAGCVE